MELKFSFNDVMIQPSVTTDIMSREECNPYDEFGKLPIFVSPMSCILNENNFTEFQNAKLHTVLPRTVSLMKRIELWNDTFVALSLTEASELFLETDVKTNKVIYICIDVANGHMKRLLDIIKSIKNKYKESVVIMSGNIANPQAYVEYYKVGCDYLRVGIGGGGGCITSSNTGVHYPMGSLINECAKVKRRVGGTTKIVADGNIKGYADINKALVLGADYIMAGSIFGSVCEASGQIFKRNEFGNEKWSGDSKEFTYLKDLDYSFFRYYYGMSTKRAQREMGKDILKTSEGLEKTIDVNYTIKGYTDNITDYMRSAMSYVSAKSLADFIGWDESIIFITNGAFNRVNK